VNKLWLIGRYHKNFVIRTRTTVGYLILALCLTRVCSLIYLYDIGIFNREYLIFYLPDFMYLLALSLGVNEWYNVRTPTPVAIIFSCTNLLGIPALFIISVIFSNQSNFQFFRAMSALFSFFFFLLLIPICILLINACKISRFQENKDSDKMPLTFEKPSGLEFQDLKIFMKLGIIFFVTILVRIFLLIIETIWYKTGQVFWIFIWRIIYYMIGEALSSYLLLYITLRYPLANINLDLKETQEKEKDKNLGVEKKLGILQTFKRGVRLTIYYK